jgi:hypothetical protein
MIFNRNAVVPILLRKINKHWRNRFAVERSNTAFSQVAAQRGDPGLEVIAPLEQRKPRRLVSFTQPR